MKRRARVTLYDGKKFIFDNRKQRKKNLLAERIALKVFTENEPYHYIMVKSASIETIVKAIECAEGIARKKRGKEMSDGK